MARYECTVCGYVYDEDEEGIPWSDLPEDWVCPICDSEKDFFEATSGGDGDRNGELASQTDEKADGAVDQKAAYLGPWRRTSDNLETWMADIHTMAESGKSITDPMRSREPVVSWNEILIKGAQLARLPLLEEEPVSTTTVIGPRAQKPLIVDTPILISHMSFGALSREAKLALARGSSTVQAAMCSGEGGILSESLESAHRYIFEYIPNQYSVSDENLRRVDAVEIKFGQSAKPGMGGHLPGHKVTPEIAAVRGRPEGVDIHSPSRYPDITSADELRDKVSWLREATGGRPVGVKFAAGHIEADLEVALRAGVDFITLDGRPGATGSAPRVVKDSTSIPTIFALCRARRFLDESDADDVSLIITGGLRVSSDYAKALALGADAVAIATAALIAAGCQQYRICHTGRCPVGITSQDPELRARLDVARSAERVANFLRVSTDELATFARLTGHADVHDLDVDDLCTTNSEIANFTPIDHV